jgi:hypothetical protein
VVNKIDLPHVRGGLNGFVSELRKAAGHSRVMAVSAATTENVRELMGRVLRLVCAVREAELVQTTAAGTCCDRAAAGLDCLLRKAVRYHLAHAEGVNTSSLISSLLCSRNGHDRGGRSSGRQSLRSHHRGQWAVPRGWCEDREGTCYHATTDRNSRPD